MYVKKNKPQYKGGLGDPGARVIVRGARAGMEIDRSSPGNRILLRNCRSKLGVVNESVSQESRSIALRARQKAVCSA